MTDREQLNEMQQFMDIANGKLPNQDVITEAVTGGMIEVGGQEYPWRRVPIEVYDQFKAEYPGSNIRFRGPRRGRDNTSKADATHFYVVRQGPNNPKPEDMARIHQPERQQELEFGPKNRPHTPGYNKLEPASRAAADSRAQAFIFDDVDNEITEDFSLASMAFDLAAGGFIGWAAVTAWPKVKEYFERRQYGNILADFEANVSPESMKMYADKLEAKLVSTHPSSRKALAGRLKSIEAKLNAVPDAETFHGIKRQIELLRGEMRRAEQFIKKSNTGHDRRKAKRKRVGEDLDVDGMGHYEVVVRRGVGTDDFYEDVVSGPLPFPEANKEALQHVRMIKSESESGARVKKSHMLGQTGWSIRPNSYSLDDKYVGGFVFIRQAEDADVEAWYGEGIELGSIVESVLEEFEGQPKDYVDPEDRVDEPKPEPDDIVTDYGSDIEDEELGLRFD